MVDKINRQRMAANYGFALSFMKSDPELFRLFNKAVKNTWAPDMFVAQLRGTKWFKQHSASVRNAILQETSDPATYNAAVKQMTATVRDTWGSLFGQNMMDRKDIRAWAETAHRMGWSEAQLIDRMSKSINYQRALRKDTLGGQAANFETQLDQLQKAYGLKLGRKWRARRLESVMNGNDTMEGVRKRMIEMAINQYEGFADRLRAGETIEDIAEPYRARMADLLEMNPSDVDVSDRKIQRALRATNDKGKPKPMSLHEFEDQVRKDKRWQYTDNAREEVSNMTQDLLRSFGLRA